jgi:hypothetical protein
MQSNFKPIARNDWQSGDKFSDIIPQSFQGRIKSGQSIGQKNGRLPDRFCAFCAFSADDGEVFG